ncbi:MAG: acyloxyacyl hydrolase [Gemmatimonadetes bacterium]|nr:acyloxyacyl hydrolase [Gemmatimonadota bacterium]
MGVAQHSPVGADWGVTEDRSHLFIGIHFRTPVVRVGGVQLLYAPNITPFLRLSHRRSAGSTVPQEPPAHAVGIAPFGIALGIPFSRTVRVIGSTAVGALWFDRVVPIPDARAFNVSLEWGGSLEWARSSGPAIELGYKFHHLSNVYSAPENPGVEANVFFLGGRWRRTVRP